MSHLTLNQLRRLDAQLSHKEPVKETPFDWLLLIAIATLLGAGFAFGV